MVHTSSPRLSNLVSSESLNRIELFLAELKQQKIDIHTIMIYQAGQVIFETEMKPYQLNMPHMSFSLAKGYIATAIGLLIDEGSLTLDAKLTDYFDDYRHITSLNNMSVRDALMMCTGHSKAMFGFEFRQCNENWLDTFLNIPYSMEPGKQLLYNSGTSYLLSSLIERVTGMNVKAYLQQKLFEPLAITVPVWEESPEGSNAGGWGLYLKAEDMMKLAILYLNNGIWQGNRILSEHWINEATTLKIAVEDSLSSQSLRGFGYHFWCGDEGIFFSEGAFGQLCLVDRQSEAIIMINGGHAKLQEQRQLVCTYLLPMLRGRYKGNFSTVYGTEARDDKKLNNYCYDQEDIIPNEYELTLQPFNKRFVIASTDALMPQNKFSSIALHLQESEGELTFFEGLTAHTIRFGLGHYISSKTTYTTLLHDYYYWNECQISCIASVKADNEIVITCRYIDKVYVDYFEVSWTSHNLSVTRHVNVSSLAKKSETYYAITV